MHPFSSSASVSYAVAFAIFVLVGIARAGDLTLDAYLAEVLERNPQLVSSASRAEALAYRESPARAWDDPFFAVGPDRISEAGGGAAMVRYQLSQTVPFPGKRDARGDAAAARAKSAEAAVDTVERELIVGATQLFYRLLHVERGLELNRELADLVADAEASGEARYRTGSAAHHQWLLAKAELGVLGTERVRLEGDAAGLRAELNELRDRPADTPLGVLVADLPTVSSEAPPPSPEASPEARSVAAAVRAAEAERRQAWLAAFPDLVVQGMMDDPRDGMEERMWGVMLGVTIPLYWPWKQRELLVAAEREREAAAAALESLENRLAAELVRARTELDTARRALALYKRDVIPATEMALESARSGYVVGRVSLTDLISVARAHRRQALEHLGARIDVALAEVRIEELLSVPPVLRLAPATPTLFGDAMGASMTAGAMRRGMTPPTTVRMGSGLGMGAARGMGGEGAEGSDAGMGGM